ncbi:sugar transferase [Variovorax ginsengisoli]|nr:sugar transferase [Variovorax ginsengisoli]
MKRVVDILAAIFFFAAFGWLYLLIWLLVLLTSGAPGIYSQPRYGKGGRVFKLYKFRSMVSNSQEILNEYLRTDENARQQWAKFQKLEKDPRITKFGALIRKTSLDELPQFWNVLIGDMSVVGPRPCMLDQKNLYGNSWNHYCAVRPGVTGLWQVSGRNTVSYSRRVALDVRYVERLSIRQDAYIFLKTIWVVATGHGSK